MVRKKVVLILTIIFERKRKILTKFEINAQKRNAIQEKWVFDNCYALVLDKNTFKPNQIFNIIKTKLISLDVSENQIESIGQLASSKNWLRHTAQMTVH